MRLWSLSILINLTLFQGCGGATQRPSQPEEVNCQYVTLPPRFCGASEDEMQWRESGPQPVRVCNGCFADDECLEEPGGRCVELPGLGCSYSAFVCVYPGDPCAEDGAGCPDGRCVNHQGRALCAQER